MMNTTINNAFCKFMNPSHPTGMIMNTEGFYFTLFPFLNHQNESKSSNCLNIFWSSWTIQTRESFLLALLGIFLLCMLFEYIAHVRTQISKKHTKQHQQQLLISSQSLQPSHDVILQLQESRKETDCLDKNISSIVCLEDGIFASDKQENRKSSTSPLTIPTISLSTSPLSSLRIDMEQKQSELKTSCSTKYIHPLLETLLYGTQTIIGYLLMTATMTYSIEILVTICLGHGLGYATFMYNDDPELNNLKQSAHPCCDFMTVDRIIQTIENEKISQKPQDSTSSLESVSSNNQDHVMMTDFTSCCEPMNYDSIQTSNLPNTHQRSMSISTSSLSEFMDCEYTLLLEK